MEEKNETIFKSKVLLFGEYSVIQDSLALAIPYSLFDGRFRFPKQGTLKRKVRVDNELKSFCHYLEKIRHELGVELDVEAFNFDISQGLFFDSTIPEGYGVGSSGAVCAAVLHRYRQRQRQGVARVGEACDIKSLKSVLSKMESHFHGASSGVDPLISYLDRPLLIKGKNEIGPVDIPDYSNTGECGQGGVFLLNTGRSRRTEPLVNLYLEKLKVATFKHLVESELLTITNNCINAFLAKNISQLYEQFAALSEFQREHFVPMIPKMFQEIWDHGPVSDRYHLKLCGAGGGGLLLGITKNFSGLNDVFAPFEIRPLFYFDHQ